MMAQSRDIIRYVHQGDAAGQARRCTGCIVITLLRSQTSTLLAQPESGMGYQTVEVEIPSGTRRGTVYNADLLIWGEEPIAHLATSVYERSAGTAGDVEVRTIRSIRVVPREPDASSSPTMRRLVLTASSRPATDGEARGTASGDVFMRFTAYSNDRRITPEKGLLPGRTPQPRTTPAP